MTTKMKGLLKGLRYISQIFDEEKEPEMEIGFPTDVKHVAHIGWDGPSVDSPSWMKEFTAPPGFQSAPLGPTGEPKEDPEIKWVSEDSSSRRGSRSKESSKDQPELPKSSRRNSSSNDSSSATGSPGRESSSKSRHSRRHHSKDSSEGHSKSNRHSHEANVSGDLSPPRSQPPDIPKKSRRKKSKESIPGGTTRKSKGGANSSHSHTNHSSAFSEPGSDPDASFKSGISEFSQSSSLKPLVEEEEDKDSSRLA